MEWVLGEDDNMSLNGFGLEYIQGFRINENLPMYIEAGAKLNMGFGSTTEKGERWKETLKAQMLRFSIPVNFAYRFNLNENMALVPYAGISFRINAMARFKEIYEDEDGKNDYGWASGFDKKVMDDATFNRFQMGWQTGVRFEWHNYSVGVNYGTDFIKLYNHKYNDDGDIEKEHINTSDFSIKFGYRF